MQAMRIYSVNRQLFRSKKLVESMGSKDQLQKAEEFILSHVGRDFQSKPILDIGVGAGRTTPYLLEISQDYTGIDYSLEMIKYCKTKYSDIRFFHLDARDMTIFDDQQFDLVFFSYNGIDCVAHEDRIRILKEVYRVLRENGVFLFSSHNIDSSITRAYSPENVSLSINPIKMAKGTYRYIHGIVNHLRNKKFEFHSRDYSIINDDACNFRVLNYYISKEKQIEQLKTIGFSRIEMVNLDGSLTDLCSEEKHPWIYYIARKSCP